MAVGAVATQCEWLTTELTRGSDHLKRFKTTLRVVPHPEEEDIVVNRPTHHLARIEKHALRRHPRKLTIPGFQGRWNEWLSYSRDLDRFCLQKSIRSLV